MKKHIRIGFSLIFLTCISFSFITNHKWEDWFITFRASKNLALGNGLVFNVGEKLMTYTSPIGTLIPALIKFLFINQSDEVSIWIYRIICSITLGSISYFMYKILNKLNLPTWIYYILISFNCLNFLIIDNTINGMESAFMVFFIYYFIYVCIYLPPNILMHLTICIAGIMFTRPDGFIYLISLGIGFILFKPSEIFEITFKNIKLFGKSILFAILLFLPWLIFTWIYYGTPIPHTIIAKSKAMPLFDYFKATYHFIISFRGSPILFLPSYSTNFGGWESFIPISTVLSLITTLYWIFPNKNKLVRSLSFSAAIITIYLFVVSGFGPAPWYLPSLITPTLIVLVIILFDVQNWLSKRTSLKLVQFSLPSILLAYMLIIFVEGVKMIKFQQLVIEDKNRTEIGLWLNENKKPGDRVFLECLGYIGYYSNMKTYDFPGMSAPEVVKARKVLQTSNFAELINYLKPEWLVLRKGEALEIEKTKPQLLKKDYSLQQTFDVSPTVLNSSITYGKSYVLFDSYFEIYHLNKSQNLGL